MVSGWTMPTQRVIRRVSDSPYRLVAQSTALLIYAILTSIILHAANLPPKNPHLADSSYPMAHGDPAQQDAVAQAGPHDQSRNLAANEINYNPVGPGHFGTTVSGIYPDGRRVFWGNGIDRIVKIDHDSYEVLATYFFPEVDIFDEARADASISAFDNSNDGPIALMRAFQEMNKLRDLANLYTLLSRDHTYFVANSQGFITAYADADPNDSTSEIILKARFQLPTQVTGPVMGLNMTFDGWLVAVTEHGWVIAVRQDFSEHHIIRMQHSQGAEEKATGPVGKGWVRNAFAIDADNGIYIASQAHMHNVVWTGSKLSTDPRDGAWTSDYLNGTGDGTGATPSLMGFGSEDQFVVITDGEPKMNVVLFWRNPIPEDWPGLRASPDRRIAGMIPVDMGELQLSSIQSQQSVVVYGYGALVVNNMPRNIPWYLPKRASALLISLLGSNPRHQPYGVQQFRWDTATRQLENSWVNTKISSPSSVPIVSAAANAVYLIGARNNRFTLEALDWQTGKALFHYVIGGQRYNVLFSATLLDEQGRIHYGTPWGRVRLSPTPLSP